MISVSITQEQIQTNILQPPTVDVVVDAIGIQGAKGDKGDTGASTIAEVVGLQAVLDSKLAIQSAEFKVQALQGYRSSVKNIDEDADGNVSQIRTWDLTETMLLLTQNFIYSSGQLSAIEYINERTGERLYRPFTQTTNPETGRARTKIRSEVLV